MRALVLTVIAAASLSGCAFDKPAQIFVPKIVPVVHAEEIKVKLTENYKDPDSAMIRAGAPFLAYMNEGLAWGGGVSWQGYAVKLQINGKNSFGAYVGYQPCIALYDEAKLRRIVCKGLVGLVSPVSPLSESGPESTMKPLS